LKHRDYSCPGLYFVTVCSDFKRCILGTVEDKKVRLSALGKIVHESWMAIPSHFARIHLHAWMVMPNHVHGILEITRSVVAAQHAAPAAESPAPGSLSAIVRSFKSEVTRRVRAELNWGGEIWQRNYFDRVIRDGQEFSDAARYIAENPIRWQCQNKLPSRNGAKAKSRRSMLRHYKGIGG
jgi:REP element-mobilizing transposase RayT